MDLLNVVMNILTFGAVIVSTVVLSREMRDNRRLILAIRASQDLTKSTYESVTESISDFRRIVKHMNQDIKLAADVAAQKLKEVTEKTIVATEGTVSVPAGGSVTVKAEHDDPH